MAYTIQVTRIGNSVYLNDPSWTVWTSNPAGPRYVVSGDAPYLFTETAEGTTGTYNPSFAGTISETSPLGHSSTDEPASSSVSLANETTWGALP
jgi:hypothetical protein